MAHVPSAVIEGDLCDANSAGPAAKYRWRGSRLGCVTALCGTRSSPVSNRAGLQSDGQAGRLALLETGQDGSSPTRTIYRFIYGLQLARKKDYTWRQYLPPGGKF